MPGEPILRPLAELYETRKSHLAGNSYDLTISRKHDRIARLGGRRWRAEQRPPVCVHPRRHRRHRREWTRLVYVANVHLELTVTRTQIYLTDEQRDILGNQAARTGRPMSELIREALDEYLRRHAQERRQEVLRNAAGLWADRLDHAQFDDARATLDRDLSQ